MLTVYRATQANKHLRIAAEGALSNRCDLAALVTQSALSHDDTDSLSHVGYIKMAEDIQVVPQHSYELHVLKLATSNHGQTIVDLPFHSIERTLQSPGPEIRYVQTGPFNFDLASTRLPHGYESVYQ